MTENDKHKKNRPKTQTPRTLQDLGDHLGDSLGQSEMLRQGSRHHHYEGCLHHDYAVATVRVSGVSLTKLRLQSWHGAAEIALTVVPATTVTVVGAVAEANGTVKS